MSFACSQCGFSRERPGRCETHGLVLVDAVARVEAPNDRTLGTELAGKYALIGILGRGGFGHVYRAWQEVLDRQVAIKLIRRSKAQGVEFRERFFLEARAVARLRGPNVVTLHDFGEEPDGRLYMVLELVEGPNLRQASPNGARVEPVRAARLALPVLRALAEAHGLGIVHRDIKPSNLMLTVDDEGNETIKVLDFGVAKVLQPGTEADARMTQAGQVVGTPRYVSPEQASGGPVGPGADLYSLGVILFELMAGRPPFQGVDLSDTVALRVHQPAPPLPDDVRVSPELAAVLACALERVAGDRFSSASAFAEALRSTPELRMPGDAERAAAFAIAPTAITHLRERFGGDDSGADPESSAPVRPVVPEVSDELISRLPPRRAPWAVVAILLGLLAVLVVGRWLLPPAAERGPASLAQAPAPAVASTVAPAIVEPASEGAGPSSAGAVPGSAGEVPAQGPSSAGAGPVSAGAGPASVPGSTPASVPASVPASAGAGPASAGAGPAVGGPSGEAGRSTGQPPKKKPRPSALQGAEIPYL